MALHFVQVEREFVEGPALSDAASALGLSEDEVLGKVVRGLSWSLEHAAPAGVVQGRDPVRAVERAAGWTGQRGAFVAALPELFDVGEGLVRFRGWEERYGKKLTSQEKDAARKAAERAAKAAKEEAERLALSSGCPSDSPADIQTMSSGEVVDGPQDRFSLLLSKVSRSLSSGDSTSSLPVTRAEPPRSVPLRYEAPAKPEGDWNGRDFFCWSQSRRIDSGLLGEKWPRLEKLDAFWREVTIARVSVARLKEAYYRFAEDPYWGGPRAKPPHPWNAFQSGWTQWVEQESAA